MAIVQFLNKSFIGKGKNSPNFKSIDRIETKGSLLLLDVSKDKVIINENTRLKNHFGDNAFKLTGKNSDMILYVNQEVQGQSKIEVSDKGGIQFIPNSNLGYGELVNFASVREVGGVREYMSKHAPNSYEPHEFYVSVWFGVTSMNKIEHGLLKAQYEEQQYISNYCHPWNYNVESVYHQVVPGILPVGNHHSYSVSSLGNGNIGENIPTDETIFNLFNFGPSGLNVLGYQAKKYGGTVIYRAYVEDLTVSGRTKEEVFELDLELYNEAFEEGGKFYNDSFSD